MAGATTYRYPLKCLKCGVHFNVYSWHGDWLQNQGRKRFCPECGEPGAFALGSEALDSEIFEHVSAVV